MPRDDGSTTFSLYATKDLLARIDAAAERNAVSRNEYVLSWLPETYDQPTNADKQTAHNGRSKAHR